MKQKQYAGKREMWHTSIFLAFLLVAAIWNQGDAQSLQRKIKLVVSADTNVFTWGQHMFLYLHVHNLTNERLSIPDPSQDYPYATLELIDEKGKKWTRGIIIHVMGTAQKVLGPKATIEEPYNLVDYATEGAYGHDSPGAKLLLGLYRVKASLLDVNADQFTFKVIPPSAEQRSIAREIVDNLHSRMSSPETVRSGKELLRKYANSIYLSTIYFELFTKLAFSKNPAERSDTLMKYSLEFLERFQNQGIAKSGLSAYLEGLENRLGVRTAEKLDRNQWRVIENELQKVKRRLKSERLKRYVDTMIETRKPH